MSRLRIPPSVALLAAAFVAGGCDEADLNGVTVAMKTETLPGGLPSKAKLKNRYVAFATKKGANELSFVSPPMSLSGPFTFQCTGGLFRKDAPSKIGNGHFAVEFDVVGTNPVQYAGIAVQRVGTGLAVSSYKRGATGGETSFGSKSYTTGERLVVLITSDGTNLTFQTRLATTAAAAGFDTIGTVAVGAQPVQLDLVARLPNKGAEIGFDDIEIDFTPVAAPAAETAVSLLYHGAAAVTHASNLMDARPDFVGADVQAALATALARLQTARAAVAALPAASTREAALKQIDGSISAIGKAKKPFDDGAKIKAASIVASLEKKVAKPIELAVMAILPQSLRDFLPSSRQF